MKLKIKDAKVAAAMGKKVGQIVDIFDHQAAKWIANGWGAEVKKADKEEKAAKETKELKAEIETKDATE